jgi:phenylacetate-coenzyme A ligase PaaK-like adenylate-forming protein
MNKAWEIRKILFEPSGEEGFFKLARQVYAFQFANTPVFRTYATLLHKGPEPASKLQDFPFLPISLFRDHVVAAEGLDIEKTFTSSGTTGSSPSKHPVHDLGLYTESFMASFRHFYGDPVQYRFLALLPGYLERSQSSLVFMMDRLIGMTRQNGSGFFLHDTEQLARELEQPPQQVKTILFGASYALLDFAEKYPGRLRNTLVMETGGMKGRKREMVREELHSFLRERLGVDVVHSEYGMTELLSQAYSTGQGRFRTPPWMKVLIRDVNDPLSYMPAGKTGGISIIDLANLYSCSFIATQDLGRIYEDGSFEVLGRFDDSDVRGCNLLVV